MLPPRFFNHFRTYTRWNFFVAPQLTIQRIWSTPRVGSDPPPTSRHTKLRSTALSMDAMANSKPLGPTVVKRLLKNSANHRGGAGRSCRCPKAKSNSGTSTEGRSCSRGKDGPGNKLLACKGVFSAQKGRVTYTGKPIDLHSLIPPQIGQFNDPYNKMLQFTNYVYLPNFTSPTSKDLSPRPRSTKKTQPKTLNVWHIRHIYLHVAIFALVNVGKYIIHNQHLGKIPTATIPIKPVDTWKKHRAKTGKDFCSNKNPSKPGSSTKNWRVVTWWIQRLFEVQS